MDTGYRLDSVRQSLVWNNEWINTHMGELRFVYLHDREVFKDDETLI